MNIDNLSERDALIIGFLPKVTKMAKKLSARLPDSMELDDLISAGTIGVMDAIDKFDPSLNVQLSTYVEHRIRGSMLDELRSTDLVSRTVREKAKLLEKAISKVWLKTGAQCTALSVSKELGITTEAYHTLRSEVATVVTVDIDDPTEIMPLRSDQPSAFAVTYLSQLKAVTAEAIKTLPKKNQAVLSMYYFEGMNMRHIGETMGVSITWIAKLHDRSLKDLRQKIERKISHKGPFFD